MNRIRYGLGLLALVAGIWALNGRAGILSDSQLEIDFTDSEDTAAKASWQHEDRIVVTEAGLGPADPTQASWNDWIITTPIAVGLSWRPTSGAGIRVTIESASTHEPLPAGQYRHPTWGTLYVRYSPDQKHWSTWQPLSRQGEVAENGPPKQTQVFMGQVSVPQVEREPFLERVYAYSKRDDVAWRMDEEAVVRDLVKTEPDFFAKHLSFVGYLQFGYDCHAYTGHRLQSFRANAMWSVSGEMETPAKGSPDAKRLNAMDPWRYKAEEEAESTEEAPAE